MRVDSLSPSSFSFFMVLRSSNSSSFRGIMVNDIISHMRKKWWRITWEVISHRKSVWSDVVEGVSGKIMIEIRHPLWLHVVVWLALKLKKAFGVGKLWRIEEREWISRVWWEWIWLLLFFLVVSLALFVRHFLAVVTCNPHLLFNHIKL